MLIRIKNIISIHNYTITCLWNDGKIRMIDFTKLLIDYPESIKNIILNPQTFSSIQYNEVIKSVYFPNIINGKDENDHEIKGELDFCPDVLLQNSIVVD